MVVLQHLRDGVRASPTRNEEGAMMATIHDTFCCAGGQGGGGGGCGSGRGGGGSAGEGG